MKIKLTLFTILVFSGFINAQKSDVIRFNTINKSELVKAKAGANLINYELNDSIFENKNLNTGDVIEIETLSGKEVLRISRISEFIPGTISMRAVSDQDESKVFSFTYHKGILKGIYHESHEEAHFFRFNSKKKSNYITKQKEEELACSLEISEEEFVSMSKLSEQRISVGSKKKSESSNNGTLGVNLENNTTVDILIAYTNNAELWAVLNGDYVDINGEIAQAMNLSQTALDNSNIPVTLRVVHIEKVDYDESSNASSGERLRVLTASPSFNPFGITDGKMDELHQLRDQYGADLVTLFAQVDDTGGIAWRLSNRTGNPSFGFSLNRVQQVSSGYTVVHEFGHNMGNAHSRTQSVQTAAATGGVFHESVGYQNFLAGTHTVMAYSAPGLTRVPVFSDPDLLWQGSPSGSPSSTGITNAALSIKKIKNVIASYRSTKTDSPIPEVSTNNITVNMNREENFNVSFDIQNSGASNLDYSIDFELPNNLVLKNKQNLVFTDSALADTLIATSFESEENFSTASYSAINSWRSFSDDAVFYIENDTATDGTNHIRFTGSGSGNAKFLYSPFLAGLTFGSYKVSYNIRIPDITGIENEQFDLILYGNAGTASAGIIIDQGQFFIRDKDEVGNEQYVSTAVAVQAGDYHNIGIEYEANKGVVKYLIDSVFIDEVPFAKSDNIPSELLVVHANSMAEAYIDIDEFTVIKYGNPYPWLIVEEPSGSIGPNSTGNVILSFNTVGVLSDSYFGLMTVTTNNDGVNKFEVPIELNVSNIVSNEDDEDVASSFQLKQNYPNPFNPSTTINFVLPEASEVSLKVFNMLGQEVATLVDGRMTAGAQSLQFDASGLASGAYVYTLKAGNFIQTKKMMLIK